MAIRIVIPARYASTRLPGKPLVDLLGLPMVVRVYKRVVEALPDCDCVVALDDKRISDALDHYAIPWVMTSVEHESGTDRIAEVCESAGWDLADIIINVQGDEPLVPTDMLVSFVDFINQRSNFEMGTISAPINSLDNANDSNVVKLITNRHNDAIYFSRFSIPFCRDNAVTDRGFHHFKRHVGVYAYRVDVLKTIATTAPVLMEIHEKLEQLRALWLGINIGVLDWRNTPPHGVDTLLDVEKVIRVLKEQQHG